MGFVEVGKRIVHGCSAGFSHFSLSRNLTTKTVLPTICQLSGQSDRCFTGHSEAALRL